MFNIITQKEIDNAIGEAFEAAHGFSWYQRMVHEVILHISYYVKMLDQLQDIYLKSQLDARTKDRRTKNR